MDDRRFDTITRALARAASRRKALIGALAIGATALAGSRRSEAQAPTAGGLAPTSGGLPQSGTLCAGVGQPCVMLTGCCSGFTCVTSAINPNQGYCQSGGTGGVQIAPPLMAGNSDGTSAQPAPTRTPRVHKTHTPGSNHTNTTNNTTRSTVDLRVAEITCYPHPTDPVGPHITLRNVGTDALNLRTLTTLRNPTYNGANPGDNIPITQGFRLKPRKSIMFARQSAAATGHVSTVKLPDDFFSTAQADIGKEGVIITFESAAGATSTQTASCPDRPEATETTTGAATDDQGTTRSKKRNRKRKQT
jgi:hypothetical protein